MKHIGEARKMKKGMNGFYARFGKRALDLILITGGFILFWWVFALVALAVRVKLGYPVLYTSNRPGKNGKMFKLYKFRSMTDDRDENGKLLPANQRTPRFGSILRSSSMDELPEIFINVLKGEMSLIGPRPLSESYLPYYTEEEMHRHDVLPGITGLAQVKGRNNLPWEDRFALDIKYVNEISLKMDIYIFFQTIFKIFKRADIVDTSVGTEINFSTYRENQWKEKESISKELELK